ncbi:photosystem I reaction center subunit PsaK [Chamaesiphon sp. VAR_48_metabat_135_sub]|jgi:photosystem I subunit X|uniref:photosystem I reaction center subunit PsaK n=1 Tax=Chamaesiphon sp. VAR_48_metabat_135_sub TaxID=2964699 RepID=UPI00286D3B05|nr:photosystem I reaction center subunit PsaK [Chamaesiphon sp. VAR_48_metabat_135_sub]
MLHSSLLLAAATPMSQAWSPTIAIVMVVCNALGVFAAATTSKVKAGPTVGGALTLGQAIGGTCFGHILGAGAILGLTSIGVI